MNKKTIFLAVIGCILLGVAVFFVISSTTFEGRLKKKYREYGIYDVKMHNFMDQIRVDLVLTDDALGTYYETKAGEELVDRVIPDVIVQINEDKGILGSFIKEIKENKIKNFDICIYIIQRDKFMVSSEREVVGSYESEIYPTAEWFTDENKKVQKWTRLIAGDVAAPYRLKETGVFTLSELSKMVSGEPEMSYVQQNDIGSVDGNAAGKCETARLAGSTMQQKKELLEKAGCGDTVIFGSYEQDNDLANGKEDIEWLVLDVKGDELLLISRYALECKPYNIERTGVSWETCTLRSWLNGDFCRNAFGEEEQTMVLETDVSPEPLYTVSDAYQGNETKDKVFLLSGLEAERYFDSDDDRKCTPTEYAKAHGAWTNGTGANGESVMCWWWVRTLSGDFRHEGAIRIIYDGTNRHPINVNSTGGCVRPAIWVSLNPS